jgi:flagella basal body P-ring formation protein FlgA
MRTLSVFSMLVPLLACGLPAAPLSAREVWHAAATLEPGDRLRPQDVTSAVPRYDRPFYVDSTDSVDGLEVRRRIRADAPISSRDIGPPLAVRPSQAVRVIWKSAGATLEMEGRAMEGGALGEEIRVHNPASSRTIRARVVAEGTAEIGGTP